MPWNVYVAFELLFGSPGLIPAYQHGLDPNSPAQCKVLAIALHAPVTAAPMDPDGRCNIIGALVAIAGMSDFLSDEADYGVAVGRQIAS